MPVDPWFKVVEPREEVKRGRSFNPDEFAIALEQVVAGNAPEDYRDPIQFFSRTCFTRALREYAGMVLRRLSGQTENTAPVMGLVTQFGGGKTHTLTALYHVIRNPKQVAKIAEIEQLCRENKLKGLPEARVAVFVGNAWDPREGRETPWVDIARQLNGAEGVATLGEAARKVPPGTEALGRLLGEKPTLILFDEVLNFVNRHRNMADAFYAFCHNLSVAMTGTSHSVAVMSLPRSQVEMTDADREWQDKILKVLRRTIKELIANDEVEITEVIRRRLFESLGPERTRKAVAKEYADWCFDNRRQLPPEWTAVDTAGTDAKVRDLLRQRFESCYPFHPATISVFQRKWQTLPQYQQTRGTLAMLAQWISWVYREGYQGEARKEPLITLGSAPLHVPTFRSVILGQLGEPRLLPAIEVDIAGERGHGRALDADTQGPLRSIHQRVGTAILFESSGGMVTEKSAHLPELYFALGEAKVDVASIENAARALEKRGFYIRRVGHDGYCFGFKPKLTKVVSDRRASLDDDEVRKSMRTLVEREFKRGTPVQVMLSQDDPTAVPDTPRLIIVAVEPELEWNGSGLRTRLGEWTRMRGKNPRTYPGSVVWCIRKPGRDLREKVELWLAWQRVEQEEKTGKLGADFDKAERAELSARVKEAEDAARDEVWASYRFIYLLSRDEEGGFKEIDLGYGHASQGTTLCGRVVEALKSNALLNESIGASYLDRHWPPAFKETGAWPLCELRKSFFDGSLPRLLDADPVLRGKIVEFVQGGEFGLQAGERVWFREMVAPEDVAFEPGVQLLSKKRADSLKKGEAPDPQPLPEAKRTETEVRREREKAPVAEARQVRIVGTIPPEVWNRLGTKLLPKLKNSKSLRLGLEFVVELDGAAAEHLVGELRQVIEDLGLTQQIRIE